MSYVSTQLELLKKKNPNEPEFIQAATEVLTSLEPVIQANPCLLYTSVENVYAVYIGVGSKEDQEKFEEFTRNYENLHIMLDHKNSVKWSFRTDSYPTTFTLKGGKIVQKEVGYLGGVTAVEDGGEKDEMRNP